ncbi:protein polybromo-1-like isoform X3 [Gigantopelta aegis]|uniref:protein polybromo-1-like isoform X3 n=1 Tax=Gigantopelta aegis TaxID=1735272 RepID=UPI001B88969C|nr:protein polybromo-1-like isoform X3 [Gigantopelta aegis]
MPAKRKRSVPPDGIEEREESPAPTIKRKKKSLQYDSQELCQELYDTIRYYKDEDGRIICETFIRAPKRRTAADYYDVVSTPIDLLKIQQKLKMEEYEDIDQLSADVELMLNNAKAYYNKTSQEYKDAARLWDLFVEAKNDVISEAFGELPRHEPPRSRREVSVPKEAKIEDVGAMTEEDEEEDDDKAMNDDAHSTISESREPDDPDDIEALFTSVMMARDGERDISLMFQLLPQKSKYPEYYSVIKEPVDLKMIAQNILDGKYKYIKEIERDLNRMIKNSKIFNEPKSQIYKDAVALKKVIAAKIHELDCKKTGLLKTSERIRTRNSNVPKMSSVCASLKYQSDEESDANTPQMTSHLEEGDSDGDVGMTEDDTPMMALYKAIVNYKTPAGEQLSEPFLKLPNRRFYPDYYEEIKKPMSLYNIRKKLKHNRYSCLADIAADMNQVFDNAKQYNQDGSKIYKDTILLRKFMLDKKKELEKTENREMTTVSAHPVVYQPSVSLKPLITEEEHTPKSKSRRSMPVTDSEKKRKRSPEETLKRRLGALYKSVYEYPEPGTGRFLRQIFMELPSRKDYPDYYQVILEPIDMTMIEAKIKAEKYPSEMTLLNDFDLMFSNARHYNEEGSLVYQDANQLDRVLKSKWRSMNQTPAPRSTTKSRSKAKSSSPLSQKLQDLFESIRDYHDKSGRVLSPPFLKLPLKSDYPDYYEIIKRPMDMQRIQQRMTGPHQYESVEDMVADFVQMFDNACKYNEPDSLIYKDALTLQRLCLEKKMELTSDGTNEIPDIKALVQELMTNLFISVYNHQDEEGRCYSDSFGELADLEAQAALDAAGVPIKKPPKFDQIRRNLDKGRYRRIDRFQEDMFKVFEHARSLSRTDSQLYEDSIDMQMFFIKIRDELCKNGEMVLTPALSYTERHLLEALEITKREKLVQEQKDDEEKKIKGESEEKVDDMSLDTDPKEHSVTFKGQEYFIGDFVYVEPREARLQPHIMLIEKFITDSAGVQSMQGNWFYRPNETYHLATRKFLEKEVFKSESVTTIPLAQIIGRCHVMFVKDYFKMKPENVPDKDVFVCESRYHAKHKCFKKIKIWTTVKNENVKIVLRETPLSQVRVASVFADKTPCDVVVEDDGQTSVLDKTRITVLSEQIPEDNNVYYEQYVGANGCFKLGDFVFLRSERERPPLARIDKLWTTPSGDAFFFGPWFVHPSEIQHSPTRLFYKREVFLSSVEDTNSLMSVIGKCSVLHIKDYCSSRLTEYPEQDVYVCESKYMETEKSIKKLGKGLKKHALSPKVTDDEIYFFRKLISAQKVSFAGIPGKPALFMEPSPLLLKTSDDQFGADIEDSQDGHMDADHSLNMSYDDAAPTPEVKTKKVGKVKNPNRRQPSGYIVFAGECRKTIAKENPEATFGDISRLVGTKWRMLSDEDKKIFEERAKKISEEMQAKQQEADRAFNESLNRSQSPWEAGRMSPGSQGHYGGFSGYSGQPGMAQGNYGMPNGHMTPQPGMMYGSPMMTPPSRGVAGMPPMPPGQRPFMAPFCQTGNRLPGAYPGMPPGQTASPHPGMPHPLPGMSAAPYPISPGGTPQGMPPHGFSMYARPSCLPPGDGISHYAHAFRCLPMSYLHYANSQQMVPPPPPPRPPSPMFVSVPPRTQRLLHSEAYLRYIEGLNAESKTIGDWDKTLSAARENTPGIPESRLPTHWLGQGAGYHGNVTSALWALRDHMLKDALSIQRIIPFDDL